MRDRGAICGTHTIHRLPTLYTYSLRKEIVQRIFTAADDVQCIVAKKEVSLRKGLKFIILFSKPDENGFLVHTFYFRTEEVVNASHFDERRRRVRHLVNSHGPEEINE